MRHRPRTPVIVRAVTDLIERYGMRFAPQR